MASTIVEEVISGKAMWAKVHTPDMGRNARWTPKYVIDVMLNAEGIEKAKKLGLEIKKDRDAYKGLFDGYAGEYIKLTRPTKNSKGEDVAGPKVIDGNLRTVPSSTLIGNGSDVDAKFFVKTMTGKAFGEFAGYLLAVKVVNLVEPPKRASDPENDFVEDTDEAIDQSKLAKKSSNKIDDDDNPF